MTQRWVPHLWGLLTPAVTLVSLWLGGVWMATTLVLLLGIYPFLEMILGESSSTDPLQEGKAHNIIAHLHAWCVPIVLIALFWRISLDGLTVFTTMGFLSAGLSNGASGIVAAHELGHRMSRTERTLSKILLIPCLYMHFYLEHNFGHHKNVATPEDPATSKFNQSVYHFWITSVFNQFINAWKIQKEILKRSEKSFISFQNDMIWYMIIQSAYLYLIFMFFGIYGLFYAVIVGIQSFLFLETINYIEHYGLVRKKLSSGRYERVQTHHSWNSNHIIGRIVLYELTRHSDHHFKSSKKYQILENKKDSPQLPYGYPTSILLALIPPLWFKIINPRIKSI